MKYTTILAAVSALAITFTAPLASAQSLSHSPYIMLSDHSMSTGKLIGMNVADDKGVSVGTVVDVLVKDKAEPTVIVSVGEYVGGGQKLVAFPLSHVQIESEKPMMHGITKQMVASMPAYTFTGLNGGGG